jgi:hypothetical protein
MRGIHLGVALPFETAEDQNDSEEILHRLLAIMCRLNRQHLRKNPDTLPLYDSGVIYTPPDQAVAPVIEPARLRVAPFEGAAHPLQGERAS